MFSCNNNNNNNISNNNRDREDTLSLFTPISVFYSEVYDKSTT